MIYIETVTYECATLLYNILKSHDYDANCVVYGLYIEVIKTNNLNKLLSLLNDSNISYSVVY